MGPSSSQVISAGSFVRRNDEVDGQSPTPDTAPAPSSVVPIKTHTGPVRVQLLALGRALALSVLRAEQFESPMDSRERTPKRPTRSDVPVGTLEREVLPL